MKFNQQLFLKTLPGTGGDVRQLSSTKIILIILDFYFPDFPSPLSHIYIPCPSYSVLICSRSFFFLTSPVPQNIISYLIYKLYNFLDSVLAGTPKRQSNICEMCQKITTTRGSAYQEPFLSLGLVSDHWCTCMHELCTSYMYVWWIFFNPFPPSRGSPLTSKIVWR